MGFKKVYKSLQEIFPEVDSRILRAVAIEHYKDPDTAVEVVLSEVIPCLTERNKPSQSSSVQSVVTEKSSEAAVDADGGAPQMDVALLYGGKDPDGLQNGLPLYNNSGEHNQTFEHADGKSIQHYHDAVGGDHVVFEGNRSVTPVSIETCDKSNDKVSGNKSYQVTSTEHVSEESGNFLLGHGECGHSASTEAMFFEVIKNDGPEVSSNQLHQHAECVVSHNTPDEADSSLCDDSTVLVHKRICEEASSVDNQDVPHPESQLDSLNVQASTLSGSESSIELVAATDVHIFELEKPDHGDIMDGASNEDLSGSMLVNEVKSMPYSVVSASGQICSVDLLEEMITDAKNSKKTLFSAIESVICLMREAEMKEEAAEQAKQEAAKGGLGILRRAEDMKEMLRRAKEANDMLAGEVYGERSILATEAKELQSRLLSLADERDKALAVLDEMRQKLEVRIAATEQDIKAFVQERENKDAVARKPLADQEIAMEKVVQESNILKQEAEENAKLRDFLVNRGRFVDILQGEISVICQDVGPLKEKFDNRVPLTKSLCSSQTSCILASSSSSLKSMVPDQLPNPADLLDEPEKLDSASYHEDGQEKLDSASYHEYDQEPEDVKSVTHNKDHLDDEWEIFDKRELCV